MSSHMMSMKTAYGAPLIAHERIWKRALSTTAADTSTRDYYEVLGVERGASAADLKKAYYRLAKEHHPDTSSGDPAVFAEVNTAYEVLSDSKRRSIYDAYGHEGVRAADAGADPTAGGGGFGATSAEDILREFGAMFGGGGGGAGMRMRADAPMAGESRESSVRLSLWDVARGVEREVQVGAMVKCDGCGGNGRGKDTKMKSCGTCGGRGQVSMQGAGLGIFQTIVTACSSCGGSGSKMVNPCTKCNGRGVKAGSKEVHVAIPAGIDNGTVLRVRGEGDDGIRGGPSGDLHIRVYVEEHEYFHRDGANLHVVAPISVAQAAVGGTVKVKTIDGAETLRVRPGSQHDDTVTISGRALPRPGRHGRGDQFVHLKVVVPDSLTERQKELFEELLKLEGGKITEHSDCSSKGLLDRFQRFLRSSVGGGGSRR